MKALVQLKETKRPISDETIGFRLQAAVPNLAGKAFGKEVPLFRGAYFITESSDHSLEELEKEGVFEKIVENFREQLRFNGYSDIEWRKAA